MTGPQNSEFNMLPISQKEFEAVSKCDPTIRYRYSLKRISDTEQLSSLKNDGGWVLLGDPDGNEIIPIWSHPIYANAFAAGGGAAASPAEISLERWLNIWLPGIERDGRLIAVFPTSGSGKDLTSRGAVVSPSQLKADLEEELMNFG